MITTGQRNIPFERTVETDTLLRRGRLRFDVGTFNALVWTIWASISPGSLRAFLSMLLRTRNLLATPTMSHSAPLRWSPPIKGAKR